MKEGFAEALEIIRDKQTGWADEQNLRKLSNPKDEEIEAFSELWFALEDNTRYQIATQLTDLANNEPAMLFESLFEVLLQDDLASIRALALSALAEAIDPVIAKQALQILQNDPSFEVRAEAAIALGIFIALSATDDSQSETLVREIEDVLLEVFNTDEEDIVVRQRALEAYAFADDLFVDDTLRDAYESEEDEIRASAVFAMGQRADEMWLPIVHRELASEAREMRLAAIYAASQIGSSASVPHLLRVIGEDMEEDVRIAAVYALAEIEAPEAGRILEDLLESDDEAIAAAADDAWEMRGTWESLDNLAFFDYGLFEDEEPGNNGNGDEHYF